MTKGSLSDEEPNRQRCKPRPKRQCWKPRPKRQVKFYITIPESKRGLNNQIR